MADRVQKELEAMVPELEDLKKRNLFNEEEIRSIVAKRTDFEYALQRRVPVLTDYLRYLEYEMNLDLLRRKRVVRMKQQLRKSSVSDWSAIQRVYIIFSRATKRFSSDINLWLQFIEWTIAVGATKKLARVFPKALALHPLVPALWIKAALYEFNVTGNIDAARVYFQRGLRLNPSSEELWREFFRMEMKFIGRIAKRKAVLGFIPTVEQLQDYKTRINMQKEDGVMDFDDNDDDENANSTRWDPSQIVPLDQSDFILLSGVIPKTIFKNACKEKAFDNNIQFKLSFIPLVSEWMYGKEKEELVQAMTTKAYNPKSFLTQKNYTDDIHLDVECLLVAGVNLEDIYNEIFDMCKQQHSTDMNTWNAYARCTLLYYNPVVNITDRESWIISQFQHYIYEKIQYTGPECVAISRFEEALLVLPLDKQKDIYESMVRFSYERFQQYTGLLAKEQDSNEQTKILKYINAHKYVIFEACRRGMSLGVCSSYMGKLWLEILYQFHVYKKVDTFVLPYINYDQQDIVTVTMEYNKTIDMNAVIEAISISGILNSNIPSNNTYDILQLWKLLLTIYNARYEHSVATSKSRNVIAEDFKNLKTIYLLALDSVAIEEALDLWKTYIQFVISTFIKNIKTNADIYTMHTKISDLYFEAMSYYKSCKENIYKNYISAHAKVDSELYQYYQQISDLSITNMNILKSDYIDWCLTLDAMFLPIEATTTSSKSASGSDSDSADEDASDSSSSDSDSDDDDDVSNSSAQYKQYMKKIATMLQKNIDTMLGLSYSPQSEEIYVKLYQLEACIAKLLHSANVVVKHPDSRLKDVFEKAVVEYGTTSVDVYMKYLHYIVPTIHANTQDSLFVDELAGIFSFASPIMTKAKVPSLDEFKTIHWRAVKTLQPAKKSIFASKYDELCHQTPQQ